MRYILGSARETVLSQRVQKLASFILLTHNLEALERVVILFECLYCHVTPPIFYPEAIQ